jgi:glycosyltransferase involved in cell wall biosynthesis
MYPENESAPGTPPLVSIGMPVYNGAKTVEQALGNLRAQSHRDFELIISDNASNDGTQEICRRHAEQDPRIRYVRQEHNRGPSLNFEYVLHAARGEFFMWAACDDAWSVDFVERNLAALRARPSAMASITPARNGDDADPAFAGWASITGGSPAERLVRFLRVIGANARVYSLFRREAVADFDLRAHDYLAGDWTLVAHVLLKGEFVCTEGPLGFFKDGKGASADVVSLFDGVRRHPIERLLPYFQFSRDVLSLYGVRADVVAKLARMNYNAMTGYYRNRLRKLLCRGSS